VSSGQEDPRKLLLLWIWEWGEEDRSAGGGGGGCLVEWVGFLGYLSEVWSISTVRFKIQRLRIGGLNSG
jgi:hypothetical protein